MEAITICIFILFRSFPTKKYMDPIHSHLRIPHFFVIVDLLRNHIGINTEYKSLHYFTIALQHITIHSWQCQKDLCVFLPSNVLAIIVKSTRQFVVDRHDNETLEAINIPK